MAGFKIIDLFSGAGGWSYGLKKAGHEIIWAVDSWRDAVDTYKQNFPDANVELKNVMEIDPNNEYIQEADIIIGSPPCKPFTLLNKNRGDDLQLTRKFIELAKGKPFIMENVARVRGLISSTKLKKSHFFSKLISMGDYGVPQVRRRYILSNFFNLDDIPQKIRGIEEFIPLFENIPQKLDDDHPNHSEKIRKRMKSVSNGDAYKDFGVYYRIKTRGIGWAVVNVTKSMMIHPFENRRLKVMEAAILQTFPPDYKFSGSIGEKAEQVGNAVPPAFSEHVGRFLKDQMDKNWKQKYSTDQR